MEVCSDMVTVFVASAMPTEYPYKLQKPSTISSRVRETAECFIMDSGIGDEISNQEVLDLAIEYNADYVVAKDEIHDFETTTENVYEFLELHAESDCEATVLVPVQCKPAEDRWHTEHLQTLPDHSHYVLGGMAVKSVSTTDQIKSIKRFREAVGSETYVHGLGVGGGMEFVSKVAGTGWLDSVDNSTPEQAGQFGAIYDERLRQKQVRVMSGEGASKRNIPLSEFNSYQLQDVWEREAQETGLAAYQ
jgi:hypothetical protein